MLRFKDVICYVEKDQPIAILFNDDGYVCIDMYDLFREQKIMKMLDVPLVKDGGIGTFRFDPYEDFDYLAFKLDCNKGDVLADDCYY